MFKVTQEVDGEIKRDGAGNIVGGAAAAAAKASVAAVTTVAGAGAAHCGGGADAARQLMKRECGEGGKEQG